MALAMKPQWRAPACGVWLVVAAACGGNGTPPSPQPGPGGGETISGSERVGWNQSAADAAELATFRYAIYVDGARSEIADVSCSAAATAFACSGRLPAMTAGSHVLELATFVLSGSDPIESPRSSPLTVTVRGVTAGSGDSSASVPASLVTSDGVRLAVETVADGFDRPSDLAIAADGQIFVAEQEGRVWLLQPGASRPRLAAELDEVFLPGAAGGLLAIALDPQFERSRHVYVLHTASDRRGGAVFRLARLREAGGTLGERAVMLDGVRASTDRPSAVVRFGPDGKLYVALDDGGRVDEAERLSSYSGKVLRVNADGSIPADQPAASPVHAMRVESPRGLDWQPGTATLWVADARAGAPRALAFARTGRDPAASPSAVVNLPAERLSAGAQFHPGTGIRAFAGDLLLAAGDALLRVRVDPALERAAVERFFEGAPGSVRAVTIGGDGAIYVATATAVVRLRPE
jgi:glucose/arabinose dehydrogenase